MTSVNPSLHQTRVLVHNLFLGMQDKGGDDLYNHLLRVEKGVAHLGEDYRHVALLHDAVEDTEITFEDLRTCGYSEEIVTAVDLLTHRKKEMPYADYIDRICASENHIAICVKISDQRDNNDPKRMLPLNPYMTQALMKRYAGVLPKLLEAETCASKKQSPKHEVKS